MRNNRNKTKMLSSRIFFLTLLSEFYEKIKISTSYNLLIIYNKFRYNTNIKTLKIINK